MVDVSAKDVTHRLATAETQVRFPPGVATALREMGLRSPKGPIFDTAIIAGVMGAKRTHELIPFCHPLAIDNCQITIDLQGEVAVIRCTVSVHHRTGVEMEALTGASIAALTVYDMCKALSHDIVIGDTRLVSKDGGSTDGRPKDATPKDATPKGATSKDATSKDAASNGDGSKGGDQRRYERGIAP